MNWEPDLEVIAQGASITEGRQRMAECGVQAAIVDLPTISSIDIDEVNFAANKALEVCMARLEGENEKLEEEVDKLRAENEGVAEEQADKTDAR